MLRAMPAVGDGARGAGVAIAPTPRACGGVPSKVHAGVVERKRSPARFFESETGETPVRSWLLSLLSEDRKIIGDDIRAAELGWPVGMPLCRPIKGRKGLWEIRSGLAGGRIARVLFCIHDGEMILLHGFLKKTQTTPDHALDVAARRMRGLT
jgi:phage-related protein